MNMRRIALLAALGSALALAGAFAFQHLGDMPPCPLCITQRWFHAGGVALGLALLLRAPLRPMAALGALILLGGAGVAFYHAGVEQHWWAGPQSCTAAADIGALSTDDLLARLRQTPVVRCDEIPWALWGVSMAGWNALLSLGLAGLWAWSAAARRRPSGRIG